MQNTKISTSRRNALALWGAAAFAALSISQRAGASSSIRTGGGLAGGGSVEVQGGVANFSVFGSRFVVADQPKPLIFGSLRWVDSNGVDLRSTKIVNYGPSGGDPNARILEGFATMNGQGEHPFSLMLFDEAGPEKGADHIQLMVLPSLPATATPEAPMATGEPIYSSDGALKSGDLQLLTFDFPG